MENEAVSQDPVYLEAIARATLGSIIADFMDRRRASKYTPLNKLLDNLVREAVPEEKSDHDTKAEGKERGRPTANE